MTPPDYADPPEAFSSPLYLLAVLCSARRSKDRMLERLTRRRLDSLGVRITFGDELTAPDSTREKGRERG